MYRFAVLIALCFAPALPAQDWPHYGGDPGETHYFAARSDQPRQRREAATALEWKTGEEPLAEYKTTPGMFEVTPLKIGNTLYLSTTRTIASSRSTLKAAASFGPTIPRPTSMARCPTAPASYTAASPPARQQIRQAAHLHELPLSADRA